MQEDIIKEPSPPKKKENIVQQKKSCLNCKRTESRTDGKDGFHCKYLDHDYSNTAIGPCSCYELKKVKSINHKSKEKTMSTLNKIFYSIRRYVAGCAIYCTVKICIFLNPKIFWVAGLITPFYEEDVYVGTGEWQDVPWNSGDPKQIAFVWFMVALAFVAVLVALWAYNQFCKKLFGEK
jgi:hypothetical protein